MHFHYYIFRSFIIFWSSKLRSCIFSRPLPESVVNFASLTAFKLSMNTTDVSGLSAIIVFLYTCSAIYKLVYLLCFCVAGEMLQQLAAFLFLPRFTVFTCFIFFHGK